jgi:hypothetical protein
MSTKQQIAALQVKNYFTATEIQETGGFVPFIAATDDLTGQQAATVPAEGINSVWAVVNHLTYLQNGLRMALLRESAEPPSMEAAWPPPGEINDANWLAARQQALDSNHQLAEVIAALTNAQLPETLPGWFNSITEQAIFGINCHLSYHTAEIITIRHMQGLRVNHIFA